MAYDDWKLAESDAERRRGPADDYTEAVWRCDSCEYLKQHESYCYQGRCQCSCRDNEERR